MDTVVLRVVDKINAVEDTLNRRLASFETQLQGLDHSVPPFADGADTSFAVTLCHRRDYIYDPHSGLAPSEVSCGESVVLPQRRAPHTAEAGCSRGRGGPGLFGR